MQLRGAEPHSLASPTTITGSQDEETGNLTGLAFSTPEVHIEREVTSPAPATAFIDASFSQVAPGTGSVDFDGNVTVELSLTVDLHIEAVLAGTSSPADLPGDCTSTPINLVLQSAQPYDQDTGKVTMVAEDFSVPPVPVDPVDPACGDIIGNAINEELAGSGHSLSVLLEGDLVIPEEAKCDTTTELTVAPADAAPLGELVTFTATAAPVADDPDCVAAAGEGKTMAGTTVDFLRGTAIVGTGVLDAGGQATFSTATLPAGTHTLSARYRTSIPFKTSSDAVEYGITTGPVVSTDLPAFIRLEQPTEFDLTVTNTQFAAPLDDARVDVTFHTFGAFPQLERFDGTAWQPVTMTIPEHGTFLASLPAFDLASGAQRVEQLRFTGTAGSQPGQVEIFFDVVPGSSAAVPASGNGLSPESLGGGSATANLVEEARRPSSIEFSFFPGAVDPHTVRQGQTLTIPTVTILPFVFGHEAQGYVEVFVDGQPLRLVAWPGQGTMAKENDVFRLPLADGSPGYIVTQLPPTIPTGVREVTLRYSGDSVYLPSQASATVTVLPARGTSYECYSAGVPDMRFRGQVTAQANLPASTVPGEVPLGNLDITMAIDRSLVTISGISGLLNDSGPTAVGEVGLEGIRFGFGDLGGATATGVTRTGAELMFDPEPNPSPNPDQMWTFDGEAGTLSVDGVVGEVVPVTLDTIEVDMRSAAGGFPFALVCEPVGEPVPLGDVRIAGVGLTVTSEFPDRPVRARQDVTLTADTGNPSGAGVVEFLDGTTTLGVAAVANGVASMTTDQLAVGGHVLSVRYFPQPAAPMLVSPEVPLTVLPQHECAGFVEEGNGAVVRLVYLELLGRCPDQAGFDHWKGRLNSGISRSAFARSIARTPEAVGLVVDDAYETMLGRAPEASGRAFWVEKMRTGTGRYDQLLADLAASPEFWNLSGSTRVGFVTRIYERLLHRAPDAAGLEHWTDRLAAGTPRRAMVLSLANLPEPLSQLVNAAYDEILGRAPLPGDLSDGITFLRRTGDRSGLYAELIGTGEFSIRAQGLPNPED